MGRANASQFGRQNSRRRAPTRGEGTHKGCPYLLFSAKKPASSRQRRLEFAIAHYDLHSSRRYALRRAPTRGAPTRFRQPHVGLSQFDAIALGIRAKTAIVLSGSLWSGRVAVPRLQHNGSPITIGLSHRPTLPQSVRRLPDRISRASSCSLAERMAANSRTRNWLFQPSLPEILARIPALLQAYAHCSSGQGLEPRVAILTFGLPF